jgi:transposase
VIFAKAEGKDAISELQFAIKQAREAKWYRRLKIIELSINGVSVSKLASQFDVCQATVRNYIKAYDAGGIDNLRPKKQPGRPKKVGHLSRDDWSEILSQTPNQYQRLSTDSRQWSLELLVRYVKEYIGEQVTLDTVSKALRRCKYRTGRSKLRIGSPDPNYTLKRERVFELGSKP